MFVSLCTILALLFFFCFFDSFDFVASYLLYFVAFLFFLFQQCCCTMATHSNAESEFRKYYTNLLTSIWCSAIQKYYFTARSELTAVIVVFCGSCYNIFQRLKYSHNCPLYRLHCKRCCLRLPPQELSLSAWRFLNFPSTLWTVLMH